MIWPNCRVIFRVIFEQVECTIANVFNLRDLVLQELVKIGVGCFITTLKLKVKCGIVIYIQKNATLHSLFLWKLLYMFRVYYHPSTGAQTIVSTAPGICHTVMDRVIFTDQVYIKI
jgi:hypothetical protein